MRVSSRQWQRGFVALAFVLCVLAAPALAQKELTVERIYGLPSLSGTPLRGVQWSPDGKLMSYERSGREEARPDGTGARGQSEIWVMDVASGERRVLLSAEQIKAAVAGVEQADALRETQTTGAGRAARARYIWAPSGGALLYASGADLYWFDVKTGAGKALVRRKSRPGDPKISPDGRWVSFVRDYDLWLVEVTSGKERRLTTGGSEEIRNGALDWVYPEELGIRTAYWWSPDSKQIAYMQMDERPVTKYPLVNLLSVTGENEAMRYPKAGDANPIVRIGVVGVRGGKTRWMDTGKETDIYLPRVDWLPDSKRVAIQRLNRAQNKLELLFAEAKSGRAEVVLTEEDRYWINVGDDLYFFGDGQRFLWGSERDGFRHLYLYEMGQGRGEMGQGRGEMGQARGPAPTGGKLVRQVTQGEWAVTSLEGVDEKGGAIYFTATEKSPLERHLYRVGLDGGEAVRVSRADGSHGIAMSPDSQHYIDTYSNVMTPPQQNLHRADGAEVRALQENRNAGLAEYALQKPEFLQVRAGEGTVLHAMMIKPQGFDAARKYPVLIFTYGGPHSQIVRNAWGGNRFLWHQIMAQKGYIIFYLDNRGMTGRGHAFESHVHKRMGEIELADQLAGVNYLKSLRYVDGSRIGIWGWSYGGYMTLYAMLNAPEVFKAGFAGAPVTAWENYDTIYTERYMSTPQQNAEGYKKSAPLNHAVKLQGKLLIAHGTADDNVHYANTVQMQEEFIKAGKYAEVMVYPERGHGVSDRRAQIHLFKRVTEFFLEHL